MPDNQHKKDNIEQASLGLDGGNAFLKPVAGKILKLVLEMRQAGIGAEVVDQLPVRKTSIIPLLSWRLTWPSKQ